MAGLRESRSMSEPGIKEVKVSGESQKTTEMASPGHTCSVEEYGDLGTEAETGFKLRKKFIESLRNYTEYMDKRKPREVTPLAQGHP